MRAAETNHRHIGGPARVAASIDNHIRHLEKQIRSLEDRMDKFVESSEAFRAKDEVLQSIPGVGPQVSRTLLAHLPELGQGSRQTITAWSALPRTTTTAGKKVVPGTSAAGGAKSGWACTKRRWWRYGTARR